ncbi:hypothetical protein RHMOL_Rhmol02G0288800 [Rhododendron molle]|uniref:Uncharacterized protein n=1 Tax=Rhododendron molle TaxID=49168 RepID=A0ACC0PY21_RHOML|nr:hypothetical protein RHMOL_Rhmol02G0288800 [Rhododendron molle]
MAFYFLFFQGKVPFVSSEGIHQLHMFVFVLAVSHVLSCVLTLALGRLKMRRWKAWEKETRTAEYQLSHGFEGGEEDFGRDEILTVRCNFLGFDRRVHSCK